VFERREESMRKDRVGCLVILLSLSSLILTLAVPINAEEEYNVLATLQSPSPDEGGMFGGDIVLGEERLMIGEWHGLVDGITAGRAYLFDTNWSLVLNLSSSTPSGSDNFGHSVDFHDDIVVIGNPGARLNNYLWAGEVHVFDTDGSPSYTLQPPQLRGDNYFGNAVAIGKDILLVGESGAKVQGINDAGNVHVYDLEGGYLTTLTSPSIKTDGRFGWSLDVSDEFIIVGEPGNMMYNKPITTGSVHVFDYDWNLVTTLNVPEQGERTFFGFSVSISGDIVVVGELWADVDGHEKAGKAYIFDTGWNLLVTLQAPVPEALGEFGIGVAVGGDLVVVGEFKGDVSSINEGKAHVFDLEGNLISTLVSPEPGIGAQFGWRVDTDGEIVIVAEVEAAVGGLNKAGKVHIFGLGEPVAEPVDEGEPVVEEKAEETKSGGGIPGFPVESIVIGILLVMASWLMQRRR
jgi:hypothetical protein